MLTKKARVLLFKDYAALASSSAHTALQELPGVTPLPGK